VETGEEFLFLGRKWFYAKDGLVLNSSQGKIKLKNSPKGYRPACFFVLFPLKWTNWRVFNDIWISCK
jgi:hypothetical protein